VASIRILRAIGTDYAHEFITKFGFDGARQPKNLTMTLGTGAATPLQLAGAYAVFANGGYRIKPYLIAKIQDGDGKVLFETRPAELDEAARVIDARNAFVMDSMLRSVVRFGTGAAATQVLGREDIAGKTGTTSDAMDGWFAGYGGGVVAVAWMGYDDPRSLGGREFGATLSLPIWNDYMKVVLARRPVQERTPPEGVVQEDEDWIYAEYAGTSEFKTIDIGAESAPAETPAEDEAAEPAEPVPSAPPAAPPPPVAAPAPGIRQ
jgi:penicillin-binding protein 1A